MGSQHSAFRIQFNRYHLYSNQTIIIHFSATWGPWSRFSECPRTSGTGYEARTRSCRHGEQGQEGCIGEVAQFPECETQLCRKIFYTLEHACFIEHCYEVLKFIHNYWIAIQERKIVYLRMRTGWNISLKISSII